MLFMLSVALATTNANRSCSCSARAHLHISPPHLLSSISVMCTSCLVPGYSSTTNVYNAHTRRRIHACKTEIVFMADTVERLSLIHI